MALTKPILLSQVAFDASKEQIVYFQVQGGSQVVANTIKIINNATGAEVYKNTQQTFQFQHTIHANTLTNNTYYSMQIQTLDVSGNTSPWSNVVQFYCYSTPTLTITNMPTSNIVANSTFIFQGLYAQSEGELLNSYVFNLYNTSNVLIATSGTQYGSSNISYKVAGLEDNQNYIIELNGVTVNGTIVTSGKINFSVDYISPNIFALLTLENDCDGGYININSNIITIEGQSNPNPPIYVDNKEVDLRGSGNYVLWNEGYSINGNFTLGIWGEQFNEQKTITTLLNSEDTEINLNRIIINYRVVHGKAFAELYAYNDNVPYYCYSNEIATPLSTEQVFIWVRRIDGIYQIKIENRGVII